MTSEGIDRRGEGREGNREAECLTPFDGQVTGRVNGAMEARGNCKENKTIHVFLCFFLSCQRKARVVYLPVPRWP